MGNAMHKIEMKPSMTLERYAQDVVKEMRLEARFRGHWRPDAWEIIHAFMGEASLLGAQGGPAWTLVYAELVDVAVKYLGRNPNLKRFQQLASDVDHFKSLLINNVDEMQRLGARRGIEMFTESEMDAMTLAAQKINFERTKISVVQPDSS